jgi:hypothetical protein
LPFIYPISAFFVAIPTKLAAIAAPPKHHWQIFNNLMPRSEIYATMNILNKGLSRLASSVDFRKKSLIYHKMV